MIDIKQATILDILPDTFLTAESKAFSAAIQRLTAEFYVKIEGFIFWGDIENASPVLLDALAAETDVPFYTTDLPLEQKRSMIAAVFVYNSRIGTVSAVQSILNAAFGGGKVTEWFDYGGEPYHFKLNLPVDFGNKYISQEVIENFYKMLEKAKNKRAKLDELVIKATTDCSLAILLAQSDTECSSIIKYAPPKATENIECSQQVGIKIIEQPKKITIYPARRATAGYRP